MKKRFMYIIIISITLFHWSLALIWIFLDKIYIKNYLTSDNKEYKRCKFPISKNIRLLF